MKINPEKETKQIIQFIQNTVRKTGLKNIVLGLSGGVDSTTALYLLSRSIPKRNIFVYYLPYYEISGNPLEKSRVSALGIPKENIKIIDIKDMVDNIWNKIKTDQYANSDFQIRKGNIMARTRMILLFDQAKKLGGLVCGTENRTEFLLGYYTRFGDEASDIEPLHHLYKTQLIQLAAYLHLPNDVIIQKPTANLVEGQTDEADFGFTYKEADEVLYRCVDLHFSLQRVKKEGFINAEKIMLMVKKNAFKQMTPYTV